MKNKNFSRSLKFLTPLSMLFVASSMFNINAYAEETVSSVYLTGSDAKSDLKANPDGMSYIMLLDNAKLSYSDFSNTTFTYAYALILNVYEESCSAILENVDFSNSTFNTTRYGIFVGCDEAGTANPYESAYLTNVDFTGASFNINGDGDALGVYAYQSTWTNVCFDNLSMYLDGSADNEAFWFSSSKLISSSLRNMDIDFAEDATGIVFFGLSGNTNNWTTLSDVDFRGSTFDGELMSTDSFYLSSYGSKAELNNVILGDGTIYSSGEFTWDSDSRETIDLASMNKGIILDSSDDTLTLRAATSEDMVDVKLTVDSTISNGTMIFEDTSSLNLVDNVSITLNTDADIAFSVEEGSASLNGGSIKSADSSSLLTKTGEGTLSVNSSMADYSGSLSVDEGTMTINNVLGASYVTVESGATLTMSISDSTYSTAIFTNESDTSSVSGAGTLNLVATASATQDSYTVSANGTVDISNITTFGGSYEDNTFTLSILDTTSVVLDVTAETAISVDANSRIAISAEDSSETSVYLAFDSSTSASITSVTTDTSLFENYLADYNATVETTEALLSLASYEFKIDLLTDEGITAAVLVSLYIGESAYDVSQFSIYHLDDSATEWTSADVSSVSYDGEYLSFIVNDFCTYGVAISASAAVPEPSTYALILGIFSLGFVAYRRRK